jgi:RNA polymerase sigma-70 factor, ECF subfamily
VGWLKSGKPSQRGVPEPDEALKASLAVFVKTHDVMIRKLSYKLTSEAEASKDLYQQTFLKAMERLIMPEHLALLSPSGISEEKAAANWLYTICLNLYRDQYAKEKRWLNVVEPQYAEDSSQALKIEFAADPDPEPLEILMLEEERAVIENALRQLSDHYRIPLIMYYFLEYDLNKISEILELEMSTVKSRLFRGREKLRKNLAAQGFSTANPIKATGREV